MLGPNVFERYGNLNPRLIGRGVTGTIIEIKRNSQGAPGTAIVELDNGYKLPGSNGGWEFLPYELEEISNAHPTVMNSSYTPVC